MSIRDIQLVFEDLAPGVWPLVDQEKLQKFAVQTLLCVKKALEVAVNANPNTWTKIQRIPADIKAVRGSEDDLKKLLNDFLLPVIWRAVMRPRGQ
jgi:hypothetical protein